MNRGTATASTAARAPVRTALASMNAAKTANATMALLIASFRLLPPDPPSSKGQLDVPGAITVTAGVALLVFAVARATR